MHRKAVSHPSSQIRSKDEFSCDIRGGVCPTPMRLDFVSRKQPQGQTQLYLGNHDIQGLKNIHRYANQTQIWLDGNPLKSLRFMANVPDQLEFINVDNTQISTLEGIGRRETPAELSAEGNLLTNLRGISLLTGLRVLDVSYNQIATLAGIEILVSLEKLDIDRNRIAAFSEIARLRNLRKLVTLCVNSTLDGEPNPIALVEGYRQKLLTYCPPWLRELDYDGAAYIQIAGQEKELLGAALPAKSE